jgi:tetrahydromethanopterin S-methyltransferase subunit F
MKAIRREQLQSGLRIVRLAGVIVGFFHECIFQGFTQE